MFLSVFVYSDAHVRKSFFVADSSGFKEIFFSIGTVIEKSLSFLCESGNKLSFFIC